MDVVFAILPKIEADAPTIGAPLLKTHLAEEGYKSVVLDFNIQLYRELKLKGTEFEYYNHYEREYEKRYFRDVIEVKYNYLFEKWVDDIISLNPKFVGLSLLTEFSNRYAYKISSMIRKRAPHLKIIWGGAALVKNLGNDAFKHNLVDYFVMGDGENNIINILKGIKAPGINNREDGLAWNFTTTQIDNLDTVMTPDYSDIDWSLYEGRVDDIAFEFRDTVYVTGSRGCVKNCTFCNVREIWPNYRFRSAASIAKEIRELVIKHNRRNIKFTDSLINGSMKEFRILLKELIELRKDYPDLNWDSQWILRSESQSPESDYEMLALSGCRRLEVGLESFSEPVRYHMGKKFKDNEMWFCFEMLKKYKIKGWVMMIVGYPTETEEDHQRTLDCIKHFYKKGYDEVAFLSFGNALNMQKGDGTYNIIKDDIVYYKSSHNWRYKDNDPAVRLRRVKEVNNLIAQLSNEPIRSHGALGTIMTLEEIVKQEGLPVYEVQVPVLATPTGIEPVISGVTGQHLNHSTKEPLVIQLS